MSFESVRFQQTRSHEGEAFFENLKHMRKQRGLTQEQIAEALGVSCQAVSKWKMSASYPDIALLPIPVDYFCVSVDCLIGRDTSQQIEEIEQSCNHANDLFSEQRYMKAIPLLRERVSHGRALAGH